MTATAKPVVSRRPFQRRTSGQISGQRSFAPWQPLFTAAAVFLLLLAAWWQIGQWYENRLLLEQRAEAVTEVTARGSALSSAVNRRLARLQGLHAFVHTEGSEQDFPQKFDQFAADLYSGSQGIRNLAVAPDGIVQYIYPREGNESVLGYQPTLDSRPGVAADVRRAIESEEIIISGPLELVQGGLGLVARQAVFQDGTYWGLVNVVLEIYPLLKEAGVEGEAGDLTYALRDHNGNIFYGSSSVFSSSPIVTQIILPEGYWELAASPREGWPALIRQPLLVSWIGSLFSITLAASLVYLLINRQTRLAAAVDLRTQELSEVNAQLEQRVEERTLELTILLNIARSMAATYKLEDLLDLVLNKLLSVIDYTGGAILTLEDRRFKVWTFSGQFPQEFNTTRSYSADNIIGQQLTVDKMPVLIPDILSDNPSALAFRQATGFHEALSDGVRSWMGIPLIASQQVIGMLALHHREAGIYNEANVDLAMAFANQVAVAIENAQLNEKAQRLAVLQERQRLARDLHDSVSQALYGIALGSRTAQKVLKQSEMDSAVKTALSEPIDYVLELTEGGLAEMRALIFELRPESLEKEGLAAALGKLAAAIHARHRIEVRTTLDSEPDISLSAKEVLYRVSQEALNNIVKHASAANCGIKLSNHSDELVLQIWDDGRGFDSNQEYKGHLGLHTMRERVEQAGGTLTITSSSNLGTKIEAAVPLATG